MTNPQSLSAPAEKAAWLRARPSLETLDHGQVERELELRELALRAWGFDPSMVGDSFIAGIAAVLIDPDGPAARIFLASL